jgi:hypothetical protein
VADQSQGLSLLDQQRLVAPLEQMSPFIAPAIEPTCECRLQPLHAGYQILLRGFQCQVVMIAHDHKGVEQPPRFGAGFEQTSLKSGLGPLRLEDVHAVVAAINHVVTGSGEFESQFACHENNPAPPPPFRHIPTATFPLAIYRSGNRKPDPLRLLCRNLTVSGGSVLVIRDLTPSAASLWCDRPEKRRCGSCRG